MQSPIWILNGILATILLLTITYIGFSFRGIKQDIKITSIKPVFKSKVIKEEKPKPKDIKFIFEGNDLFQTVSAEVPEKLPEVKVPTLPTPPTPKPIVIQQVPDIQFLEPLPIKITGIIFHPVESESQVTFINTKTKESESYKVGDKVFDAYIIRILPKKVILIRSNGQQETIYLYPEDAQEEIKAIKEASWADVIQKKSATNYIVNSKAFAKRITSLAQLIESLHATTAFSKGISVGCRIGKMEKNSIGYALGLMPGDVITKIGKIEPTTTAKRVEIYNMLYSAKDSQKNINVEILRGKEKLNYTYIVKDKIETRSAAQNKEAKSLTEREQINSIAEQLSQMSKYYNTNQTKKLEKEDRQAMMNVGKKRSVLKNLDIKKLDKTA